MDDLLEKIVKVFDEDNELCLVDECPKDLTCGECWKNEIEKFINNIYNKAIDEAAGYIENEWALERINSCDDFDKISDILHK